MYIFLVLISNHSSILVDPINLRFPIKFMIIGKQKNQKNHKSTVLRTYINYYYYENKKYYGQKLPVGSIKMQIRHGPINLRFIRRAVASDFLSLSNVIILECKRRTIDSINFQTKYIFQNSRWFQNEFFSTLSTSTFLTINISLFRIIK